MKNVLSTEQGQKQSRKDSGTRSKTIWTEFNYISDEIQKQIEKQNGNKKHKSKSPQTHNPSEAT